MVQRQTPKAIKQKQKQVKYKTISQYRARYSTGALSPYTRVEPDCSRPHCARSYWQQPASEPIRFVGEKWSAKYGRLYEWEFEDIGTARQFCEDHHRDVMEQYLFRQLRLGVI